MFESNGHGIILDDPTTRRQHQSIPRQPRDDLQHREAVNPTVPRTLKRREPHDYNKQQHQRQVRRDYCYEQGHVKQKCGHGRPVICRACGEEGLVIKKNSAPPTLMDITIPEYLAMHEGPVSRVVKTQ